VHNCILVTMDDGCVTKITMDVLQSASSSQSLKYDISISSSGFAVIITMVIPYMGFK